MWRWGLVVGCLLAHMSASVLCQDSISDAEANKIADKLLLGLDSEVTSKTLRVISAPDPETIPDDPEEGPPDEDYTVAPRINIWSTIYRVGRSIGTAAKNAVLSFFRNLRKAAKFVLNKLKESTKKVWEKLKQKFGGDMKEKMKKAGKKLAKKVLKEVFEEGAEMAVEYVQALVIDYLHNKTEQDLCTCPMDDERPEMCKCCINLPGFAKACMVVRARPKLQWFVFSFRYNGTEFLKAKVAEDERGPCEKGYEDLSRKVCKNLPHYLHFLNLCFVPGDMYELDGGGLIGCFRLSIDSLKLGVEKCALYDKNETTGRMETTLFNPAHLGLEDEE